MEQFDPLQKEVDSQKNMIVDNIKLSTHFEIKDSGERKVFSTGMQRDSGTKTLRPDLIWLPGLIRLAEHMGNGALKYEERNWEKASTEEELERFRASAFRHFIQWFNGERDEDHVAAVIFNLFGAEMVKEKLDWITEGKLLSGQNHGA